MKKKKIKEEKRSIEKLLIDIDGSLKYLSTKFHITGYGSGDLKQIMILNIIKTYNKNKKYYSARKLGFWFLRCKWALLNVQRNNSKRNPLSHSISINKLD